eukprot:TRINITY_DN19758_c0_g1_i1.p1 TRINITY_DN19758_c0_g1~~TRINITY_DN19758_c0_g1_i1.p1  ORF type:complete len:952 (+),score=166.79 TRINITY_DN19758_c0_g1_i1:83-2857(+)
MTGVSRSRSSPGWTTGAVVATSPPAAYSSRGSSGGEKTPQPPLPRSTRLRRCAGAAAAASAALLVAALSGSAGPGPSSGDQLGHGRPLHWNDSLFPRVIHQTWIDANLPGWSRRAFKTWDERNIGYRHHLWTDDQMLLFVRSYYPWLLDVYTASRPIERADIFRYAVLHREGGVYADLDVSCSVPCDAWPWQYRTFANPVGLMVGLEIVTGNRADWFKWWSRKFQMVQWTIAAAPGHPALMSVLTRIERLWRQHGASRFGNRSANVMETTGPGVWTDAVAEHLEQRFGAVLGEGPFASNAMRDRGAHIGDVLVLPVRAFGSGSGHEGSAGAQGDALVMHNFQGSWKPPGEQRPLAAGSDADLPPRLGYESAEGTPPTNFKKVSPSGVWADPMVAGEHLSVADCCSRCLDYEDCSAATVLTNEDAAAQGATCPTYDCGQCNLFRGTLDQKSFKQRPHAATYARDVAEEGTKGFRRHAGGYWKNTGVARENTSVAECASACRREVTCKGFEVYIEGTATRGRCYTFLDHLQEPFSPLSQCHTYVLDTVPSSAPAPEGFWRRAVDGHWANHGDAFPDSSIEGCADRCRAEELCKGFEVYVGTTPQEVARARGDCYIFTGHLALPFSENAGCRTYLRKGIDPVSRSADSKRLLRNVNVSGIPRLVHQTYAGEMVPSCPGRARWIRSWMERNPRWSYLFWDNAALRDLVAMQFPSFLATYDAYPKEVQRSDAARVVLMHAFGGVYADLDFEALASFEPLRAAHQGFFAPEPAAHSFLRGGEDRVCNALLASAPRHPFWAFVVEMMQRAWANASVARDDVLGTTGPALLNSAHERWIADRGTRAGITKLPSETFYPEVASWNLDIAAECTRRGRPDLCASRRTNATVAVHHWQCSWCRSDECLQRTPISNLVPGVIHGRHALQAIAPSAA